jgi:hypothetical protein
MAKIKKIAFWTAVVVGSNWAGQNGYVFTRMASKTLHFAASLVG